jgi:uncharacterized protein (DUF1697 family)
MTSYIAMLRGINVSGQKIIKMERLRATFEGLGFGNVRTYVQSGNLVFETGTNSAATITRRIEERILNDFGFAVRVFLIKAKELNEIAKENPFVNDGTIDQSKLHVTFLSDRAPTTAVKSLAALAVKPERFQISGQAIYLYCPNDYGRSKLANNAIERKLGVEATTRNWKTVKALLSMANDNITDAMIRLPH